MALLENIEIDSLKRPVISLEIESVINNRLTIKKRKEEKKPRTRQSHGQIPPEVPRK